VSAGFLEVSGGGSLALSFLVVSVTLVESVAEVDLFPAHEAKETAKAKAKAPNFNVFFIFFLI
jgi:hypothetical protein